MGDAKKTGAEAAKPDRLAKAIQNKRCEVTIDGRKMTVVKWNLKTSCQMMVRLGKVLEKVIGSVGGEINVATFLRKDLTVVLNDHYDDVVAVLSNTVQRENFKTVEEATAWVEELGLAEAVELFSVIVEQNLRPLVQAAQGIAEKVKGAAKSAAQKELRPST